MKKKIEVETSVKRVTEIDQDRVEETYKDEIDHGRNGGIDASPNTSMIKILVTPETYQELIMRKASEETMNHAICRLIWMKAVESTRFFRACGKEDEAWIAGKKGAKVPEEVEKYSRKDL